MSNWPKEHETFGQPPRPLGSPCVSFVSERKAEQTSVHRHPTAFVDEGKQLRTHKIIKEGPDAERAGHERLHSTQGGDPKMTSRLHVLCAPLPKSRLYEASGVRTSRPGEFCAGSQAEIRRSDIRGESNTCRSAHRRSGPAAHVQ